MKQLLFILLSLALFSCSKSPEQIAEESNASRNLLKQIGINIITDTYEQSASPKVYPSWEVATEGLEVTKEDYEYPMEGKVFVSTNSYSEIVVVKEKDELFKDHTAALDASLAVRDL